MLLGLPDTLFRFGVAENGGLMGIIRDEDLRRNLDKGPGKNAMKYFLRSISIIKDYLLLSLLLSLAVGCVSVFEVKTPPESPNQESTEFDDAANQLVSFIATASEGSSTSFDSPNFGKQTVIITGPFYTSALGLECRQANAHTASGNETIAICKDGEKWKLAPRISSPLRRGGSR